jgi:heme exporter protein B
LGKTGYTWNAWLSRTTAVFEKDFRSELRTRYALNAILIFAVTSLVSVSFALAGAPAPVEVQSAVLWILIFFAAMAGLARVFVHEEERGTAGQLRLAADPGMVFTGKFLFNLALLFMVEAVLVPLYVILMNLGSMNVPLFVLTVVTGSIGLAATGTLIGAIVARARTRSALFAALAFPVLIPVLVTGVSATRNALSGGTLADSAGELRVLFSYDVVIFTGGLLLFDFVWTE